MSETMSFKYREGCFHVSTWNRDNSIVIWRSTLQRTASGDPLEVVLCYHPCNEIIDDSVIEGWRHILDDKLA